MRTTIQIPDRLFKDLLASTGARTKTSAILQAVQDFVRRREMARLKTLSGKIRVEFDWKAAEAQELKDAPRSR